MSEARRGRGRTRLTVAFAAMVTLALVAALACDGWRALGASGTRAKVLACDDSDLTTLGHVRYGTQMLNVELLDAPWRGYKSRAANVVRGQMELDTLYRPGDTLLVTRPGSAPEEDTLTARTPWRLGAILGAFALFAVLLVAFGGAVGLQALLSFVFCCVLMWRVAIPLMLQFVSASLVAFAATCLMTAAIMLLVGGWTRKALAAFGGSLLGVAAALGLARLFGALMGVNGATLPFVQTLVYSGFAQLDLADVFVAATVLAASGAMMDLAMDIAAGVREVARHNPALPGRELLLSGLRIGRATVGTMTTTLLLAYSGGYLSLLMVFAAQGTPWAVFLNSPLVAAEVAKTLVGSFALVLVAPMTAVLSAALFRPRIPR